MGTRGLWVIHEARLHMMIFSQRKKSVNFSEIKKKHKTKYFHNYSRPLENLILNKKSRLQWRGYSPY